MNSKMNDLNHKISGNGPRVMLAASAAIFGTLGAFTRNINLSSGELALYRAVLAAGLIILYLSIRGQRIDLNRIKKEIPLLLLSGFAMGINWILLFEAYRYTRISIATLSYYFAPVIVTAASPILFKEKLTVKQIICFVMSTVGLILIIGVSGGAADAGSSGESVNAAALAASAAGSAAGQAANTDLKGIFFGLGAAVFYAAVILLNKFIKKVDGIQRTLLQFIAAIIVITPYVALTGGFNIASLTATGLVCLLIVGLFHTGITYCMYFSALKELPGQEAAILSYIDPFVAMIVSVAILGESISLLQAVGGAMILGFTLWNERG